MLPVAALPAAARIAGPDPIFAIIEAHRGAWDFFERATAEHLGAETDAEDWCTDPVNVKMELAVAEASQAEEDAAAALLNTAPCTLKGVVALLRYSAEFDANHESMWPEIIVTDDGDQESWHVALQRRVADAAEALGAEGVVS